MFYKVLEYRIDSPEIPLLRRLVFVFLRVFVPIECYFLLLGRLTVQPIINIATALVVHYTPFKWISSFYGYHKIFRLYLHYAQQGVFAVTFITRSSALFFTYTEDLSQKDINRELIDEYGDSSRYAYLYFVLSIISTGICEALSMDATVVSEKHMYNLPYSSLRFKVTCAKYYGLAALCHLHFLNTRGSNWITAFSDSQKQNIYYEWEIRKLTFLWMIGFSFIQYLIYQPVAPAIKQDESQKFKEKEVGQCQDFQKKKEKNLPKNEIISELNGKNNGEKTEKIGVNTSTTSNKQKID